MLSGKVTQTRHQGVMIETYMSWIEYHILLIGTTKPIESTKKWNEIWTR